MKKILFILPLIFIGNITLAQTRPGWANCNIGSNTLFDGTQCPARTTCVRAQGTNDDARYGTGCGDPQQVNLIPQLGGNGPINQNQACNGQAQPTECREGVECRDVEGGPAYAGQTRRHAWQCKEWPQVLGGDSQVAPKKCANGAALVNGKCPDCMETLKPNTPLTSQDMYAWWTSRQTKNQATPSKPERIVVGIPGSTISGFINPNASCAINLVRQAGPGIGTQIPAADLARYNTCLIQGRPIACAEELYEALDKNPAFDEILKKRCPALPPNTNASVIDALWGLLTHRKPY